MMSDERGAPGSRSVAVHTAAGQRSVLLVDDDELLARSLRRMLQASGFEVVVASNGTLAMQAIIGRSFDVILSDVQMPGMSGVELLGLVRAYDLDVPVILMTGQPSVATAMKAMALGVLQFLPKPTPNEVLIQAVERASRLHRMAQMKRDALRMAGGGQEALAGDRAGLVNRFETALASMWLAFQPIVSSRDRKVFGYEAFVRTSEASLPHPGALLLAAERLDRLPDIGRRIRTLAADAFTRAPPGALLFVNLHTRDLLDPALCEPGEPLTRVASRVVLEISERSAIENIKDILENVRVLRRRGFRIAIDDLGAGHAGLSSFVALEPEIVKLDISLIRGVHLSEDKQRLVASMLSVCKEMAMSVVAEGIEVAQERACVEGLGCDLLQGYLFAKPGPPFPKVEGMP
jgi:EAL domain-containing protein (putative c-di-GMP-specific phosphodiesterase class I)